MCDEEASALVPDNGPAIDPNNMSINSPIESPITKHPEADVLGSARTPWYGTSMVLLADVLGTGVLSLPYAAVTLGWASAIVCLVVFSVAAKYSGVLLSDVRQQYPDVRSYADAATELVGVKFGHFTMACMLLNWGALAVYFLVASSDALQTASGDGGWLGCKLNRTLVSALTFVVACQVRDFHSVSKYLSVPSFIAIVTAIIITLVSLVTDEGVMNDIVNGNFGNGTTVGPSPGTNAFDYITAMSSIVFAYQGQSIFFEMMAEMKQSTQFPKAATVAYTIMLFAYVTTVIIAYGSKGSETPGFLPNILEAGSPVAVAVGILTYIHIVVAYVVTVQPIHVWIHSTFRSSTLYQSTFGGTRDWVIITVLFTTFVWFVANLIPFFADIQGIIGSLFGAPIMFGWPPLFYWLSKRRGSFSNKEAVFLMGKFNAVICGIMLFACVPTFVIVGTYGGVATLVSDARAAGNPFGC